MPIVAPRFISNSELWREIQSRVAAAKRVHAAIAYFGKHGASLLKLKKGDSIVVDMSIGAVRQGVTNPHEIRTLIGRGVKVFSRGSLHAKFLVIDKTLIASSANAAYNSKDSLDEAGIITSDPAAVRRATDFFNKLCTEPIGREYLKNALRSINRRSSRPRLNVRNRTRSDPGVLLKQNFGSSVGLWS